jgi:protection-of-telomeres protein 1
LALEPLPGQTPPNKEILTFVARLYHSIDKSRVPEREVFKLKSDQALSVKSKLQDLANVTEGKFYDLIVQVVRAPYDIGDAVTLWVSDYTEHPDFHQVGDQGSADGAYADPMGYTDAPAQNWIGPVGKMSLQVTCWEPHAQAVRSSVAMGTYLELKNVQIRFGRNGASLEGFMRGDTKFPSRVNLRTLSPEEDSDHMKPRLRELLRRKREYEGVRKRRQKQANSKKSGKKRKAQGDVPGNARGRRNVKRGELQVKEQQLQEDRVKLNPRGTHAKFFAREGSMWTPLCSRNPVANHQKSTSNLR